MIKRIKILDFKSIREAELELGPVTVLVGRSGTGKSNLVQAIRFLRNLLLDQNEAIGYEFGWERIVPVGETGPKTAIEVLFSIPGEERDYSYRLGFGMPGQQKFPGALVLKEERLCLGEEILFARRVGDNNQWQWEKVPRVSPTPQPNNGNPMLGLFPSLQQVVFANAALSTGVGYYHFPSTTLSVPAPTPHG
jgi:AAA ATPase domain